MKIFFCRPEIFITSIHKYLFFFTIILFGLLSCNRNENKTALHALQAVADSIRIRYVPDGRDEVYDISVTQSNGKPVVQGVTSVAGAKTDLLNYIREIYPEVVDSVRILPDERLGDRIYAVANVSVANLRIEAGFAEEMATQLLLGMPMQILQSKQGWYRVKTHEGYVAWIHRGTVTRMNREMFHQWETDPKVIFTDDYGFAYETPDEHRQRSSDLVFGNLLKWESDQGRFYRVSYPDGRQAYVLKSQSRMFSDWKASVKLTEESIVEKALGLKGIPYSWGGTSVKTMDCSGFTKTVYLKHGIVLKRDASQQAKTGIPVNISEGYEQLRPGDLLFFGKKAEGDRKERVRHVAIYLGNKEFIHAAGDVHISSFDPAQPNYDEGNTNEFIHASRILGASDGEDVSEWN
jgi:cell wall-associated NlpC family hydrolase